MDHGKFIRRVQPYGAVEHLSCGGKGSLFTYFDKETSDRDVMMTTHTITLTRLVSGLKSPKSTSSDMLLIWTLIKSSRGTNGNWWPLSEGLGLYLAFRTVSQDAMTFSTVWYSEMVRERASEIVFDRRVFHAVLSEREQKGCVCGRCEISWLAKGWTCSFTGR